MNLYAFITLSVLSLGFCEECRLNIRSPEMEPKRKLKKKLNSYPEILKPPTNNGSNILVVTMYYVVQYYNFDSEEEILTLTTFNKFFWQDGRFTWKPEDYERVKWFYVSRFDVWTPRLKLVNTADADSELFFTKCGMSYTGYIRCTKETEHKVFCVSDLTNWPYDTKSCTLQFDQWRPQETKLFFNLSQIHYRTNRSYLNAGWMITRKKVFRDLNTGIQLTVKFHFERLAEGLEAIILVPAFVLSVLTVIGLLLDYRDMNRLGILSMTIISHFLFSNVIADHVPKHSANTPVILSFISCSTIITVICFVLSFFFKYLGKKKTHPPMWIISCNDFVLDGYGKYGVLTRWEVTEQDPEMKQNVEWVHFISISNSVCIFVMVITYIYLLSEYIPKKPVLSFVFDIA
ncbi:neuronal acetylcholine receptor subunit alpha-3-like [Leguminivora glycinivorella]|uniref:neuronal acetylcholine receptor subunit alpha-3-like n=1 Tax=Leguminivora glycinivorella TaxID=1035111 RepID=UPI00200BEDBA|nr:neuronal acetylcholine receptor subunit alpha-3-like [Leguminivora glycinivorella]